MVFSSVIFLFYFFPIFLLLYFIAPVRFKNLTALLGSLFFYAWGAPAFVFLLVFSIVIDFVLGQRIAGAASPVVKKRYLTASLILNLGLLGYFKYANFFIDNLNGFLEQLGIGPLAWLPVVLPIGISFFTFQKISFIVDVYRNTARPLNRLTDFALYILLFPQLIAGPIVRYNEIEGQIRDRKAHLTVDYAFAGLFRFIIGLAKKVLIANPLGQQVDRVFDLGVENMGTGAAWIIAVAYAFQIYYDFSGYSDMAIGLGKMMGFRLPENFNFPYISGSITEFWRRWHISLSQWMRDYLYIPLGGNKVSPTRLYINLWIVFLLSGLWHGAAWNFVLWGIYHGCFLALDRLFLLNWLRKLGSLPAMAITFLITLFGWVLFRAENLTEAMGFFNVMFIPTSGDNWFSPYFQMVFAVACLFCFVPAWRPIASFLDNIYASDLSLAGKAGRFVFALGLGILCVMEVLAAGFNPFIYFRF